MEKKSFLSEGILIAAVPALGYILNYTYELGYNHHFHIIPELITLSASSVIYSTIFVTISLLGFLNILDAVYILLKPVSDSLFVRKYIPEIIILLIYLLFTFILGFKLYLNFLLVFILAHVVIDVFIALIVHKDKSTLQEKLIAVRSKSNMTEDLHSLVISKIGIGYYRLVWILIILLAASFSVGLSKAEKKKYFYVSTNDPTRVLLKIYGENMIVGKLAQEKGQLEPIYEVERISEHGTEWKNTNLGKLTVKGTGLRGR